MLSVSGTKHQVPEFQGSMRPFLIKCRRQRFARDLPENRCPLFAGKNSGKVPENLSLFFPVFYKNRPDDKMIYPDIMELTHRHAHVCTS